MVKIFIDPGHGGTDSGATGNGLKEKNVTLKIAKQFNKEMKKYKDVTTKMSRTNDKTVSLQARTDQANKWNADLFVSVHINSAGGVGFESYVYTSINGNSKTGKAQTAIHNAIVDVIGIKDRGKKKENLHVVRETKKSAVLTENGFIDTKAEAKKMKSTAWIKRVGRAHAKGVAEHFGLKKKAGKKEKQKYVKVKVKSLWVYDKKDWDAKKKTVSKGEVFTVNKTHKVGNSKMHELKSGLYITNNSKYVKVFKR